MMAGLSKELYGLYNNEQQKKNYYLCYLWIEKFNHLLTLTVGAKHIFLQPQLFRNIDSIIQLFYFFWQCNHYLLDELQPKHPSGFNKIYTQHFNGYAEATYKISFFPDDCFARKWRLKFQVSKYHLRWNAESMTSSIMSPKKKLHNYRFYEIFTTGNRLVCIT